MVRFHGPLRYLRSSSRGLRPILLLITPSLYVYNKIDSVSLDFLDGLAREPNTAVMSCELDLGIQDVVDRCWQELRLLRIYTKRQVLIQPTAPSLRDRVNPKARILTSPQKGHRPRFLRGAHREEQLDHRERLRPDPPHFEG